MLLQKSHQGFFKDNTFEFFLKKYDRFLSFQKIEFFLTTRNDRKTKASRKKHN